MAKEVQDEINELLGELDSKENENETQGTEDAAETAESGEAGGAQQESESEAENQETSGTEEQQESSEAEGEIAEDSDREETPEEENQRLRAELDRISGEVQKTSETQQSESSEEESSESEEFDPLMGYDFDSLMEDKSQFAEWAKKLHEDARARAREEVLQKIPDTVNPYIEQQLTVREQANRFYQENPELSSYKQYVARLANDVASEMPDKGWEEVLEETKNRAYKNLNLSKQEKQSSGNEQVKTPGLAKGTKRQSGSNKGQGSKNSDRRSTTEKEIDELLDL